MTHNFHLSPCTPQVFSIRGGKRCAGKANKNDAIATADMTNLCLVWLKFLGRGPTYLIWTAVVFFNRLGSNGKLQANDPSRERICPRGLCTRICPAWFAERYELRANDPGHGALGPRKAFSCIYLLHRLRSKRASTIINWLKLHFRIEIELIEVRLLRRLPVGMSLGLQGPMYLVSEGFMQFNST